MNTSAVICITWKNNNINLKQIARLYDSSDIFVCPIDETTPTGPNVILPVEFVGREYQDYAFCLTEEELSAYLALKASLYFLKKYESISVISDNEYFPKLPDAKNAINVFSYVIEKNEVCRDDFNLNVQPLYCNHSFSIKSGAFLSEFLLWSEEQYDRILLRNGKNRGFLKTWLSYASFFQCQIHSLSGIPTYNRTDNYGYACFDDGIPIVDILREYYGKDYRLRRKCGGRPFANSKFFLRDSVIVGDSHPLPLTAIEKAVYDARPDLQSAFADINDVDTRTHFTEWFLKYAPDEYQLSERYTEYLKQKHKEYIAVCEEAQQRRKNRTNRLKRVFSSGNKKKSEDEPSFYPFGINLCGFIKGDFGLGESMRILARILEHTGIPYTIIEIQDAGLHTFTNIEFEDKISNEFRYSTNIFAYNPDCFEDIAREFDKNIFKGRKNIGYWAWEMPEFPEGWEKSFSYFDEIWTCSDFTTQSILQKATIPVHTVPYAIQPQKDDLLTRDSFGLPENKFIFLLTYDTRSISERKNPMAAVKAFCKAFDGHSDACLLIKMNTPLGWSGDGELDAISNSNENIIMVERQMSKSEINSLISLCDAYLSLHRSEGFGLGPAEAMAFGKPVILTNFGGNTQYMRDGACCPVPYQLIEVEKNFGIYKKGMHWADPDINAAAEYMKKLVNDKNYCNSIGKNAENVIKTEFSYSECGAIVMERIKGER